MTYFELSLYELSGITEMITQALEMHYKGKVPPDLDCSKIIIQLKRLKDGKIKVEFGQLKSRG